MTIQQRSPVAPSRVVIYTRVSSTNQEENSSLETQLDRCRQYAADRGWTVVGTYRDVHTGADLFERPQLARLREAVRTRDVDVVLAYALDRVSRSQAHLGFLISEWDHLGVALHLVTEEFADTPEGRLLQSVRGFVAEMERMKIMERTQRGIQARVQGGKPLPGQKAPYGYSWRDAQRSGYAIHPEEHLIVRRIYHAILSGETLRGTAMRLTQEGIPTPTNRAKRWEPATLHTILKNPVYTGHPVAFRTTVDTTEGRKSVRYTPSSSWIHLPDDVAPAIVTEEEFAGVQQRLAVNRATAPRNNANPEATLLRCGIGRCGYCGASLQITRRKNGPHLYRCHPVSTDRYHCPSFGKQARLLDPVIWETVERVLLDPEIIAREVERRRDQDPFEPDLKSLERRMQDIDKRQKRLARIIATLEDDEAEAPLVAELRQLGTEAREMQAEHERMSARARNRIADTASLQNIMSWCKRVSANLESLAYKEKRLVLEALGVSVRLYRMDHDPHWELTMAPLPINASDTDPLVFSSPR